MDSPTKSAVYLTVILTIIVIGLTFYLVVMQRDYVIFAEASCNPENASCFVRECDNEYENCGVGGTLVYKIVAKEASRMPNCDPRGGGCDPHLRCGENEPNCEITFCDPNNLEEDQSCY